MPITVAYAGVLTFQPLVDLINVTEVFNDLEPHQFVYTYYEYMDDNYVVRFGYSGERELALTLTEVCRSLRAPPDSRIWPLAPPDVRQALNPHQIPIWIKRPTFSMLRSNGEVPDLCAQQFLREARLLESFAPYPPENIARYLGCIKRQGHITGIVYEACEMTVQQMIEDERPGPSVESILDDLWSGTTALHYQSNAHNNLNPRTVGIACDGTAIILDLGTCRRFGIELRLVGCAGWAGDFESSDMQNDHCALERLGSWMRQQQQLRQLSSRPLRRPS